MLPDRKRYAAEEAYQPLRDMINAAKKDGFTLVVCSAYRSVERQKELFDEDLQILLKKGYSYNDVYEEVAKETMPPGCSEHATGLAFDIVSPSCWNLTVKQETTKENQWLQKHCAEYGFILRYPKGKEHITNVSYEPWRFRYVGVTAAKYIMTQNITLEEFLSDFRPQM